MGRPLYQRYSLRAATGSQQFKSHDFAYGGFQPLFLGGPDRPMMLTKNGGYIPAAQDPTDPRTWMTPVRFT